MVLAAGTLGSTEILLRSREQGLALSDRLGQRFSANGDIIAFGYGAKVPINAVGVGYPPKVAGWRSARRCRGRSNIRDAEDLDNELAFRKASMPSALAPVLPVLFVPNGRLLGALQSLIAGVYKGPFAHLQTFFAVSHDSASGRFSLDGRPADAGVAGREGRAGLCSGSTPSWKRSSGTAAATTSRTRLPGRSWGISRRPRIRSAAAAWAATATTASSITSARCSTAARGAATATCTTGCMSSTAR